MKITTKARYALRLLLDLAQHNQTGFIALKDVAKRQDISKKYLEQIVPVLNQAGLLLSNRGVTGGYQLAKEPEQITVGDVIRAAEGNAPSVPCLVGEDCGFLENCYIMGVWRGLEDVMENYVNSVTLAQILVQQKERFLNTEQLPNYSNYVLNQRKDIL